MEDERTQPHLLRVPTVDVNPLPDLVRQAEGVKVILLNALRDLLGDRLTGLVAGGNVSVDVAMLEGVGGIANLCSTIGPERILFGTFAPAFVPESAVLKMKESALDAPCQDTILQGNAQTVARRRLILNQSGNGNGPRQEGPPCRGPVILTNRHHGI